MGLFVCSDFATHPLWCNSSCHRGFGRGSACQPQLLTFHHPTHSSLSCRLRLSAQTGTATDKNQLTGLATTSPGPQACMLACGLLVITKFCDFGIDTSCHRCTKRRFEGLDSARTLATLQPNCSAVRDLITALPLEEGVNWQGAFMLQPSQH